MAASRFLKTDFFFLAAVLILLALQIWFPPLRSGVPNDTWGTSADGKKAFYLLTERQRPYVSRNGEPIETFVREYSYGKDTILCMLGPVRPPSSEEWSALLEWVHLGGRILYAVPSESEKFAIESLDIKTVALDGEERAEFQQPAARGFPLGDIDGRISSDDEQYLWNSARELSGPAAEPILLVDDTIQAVRQRYGAGQIVVVASDDIFSNRSLAYEDNDVLAWRLLEGVGDASQVVFDEYLNSSGAPKMLAILLSPRFRPMTLQFVIVLCVYCWWRSHRFGPFRRESVVPRRNIVDHTDAMGNMLFRQKRSASYPLKIYLQQFITELNLRHYKGRERRILEPIAMRMGVDVEKVVKLLQQSSKAARSKSLERRTAAKLIARLARVREASRSGMRRR